VSQLPELVLPLPVSVSRTACRGVPLERRLARVSAAYAPHPVRPEWLQALASAACPAAAVLPRVAASASDVRAPLPAAASQASREQPRAAPAVQARAMAPALRPAVRVVQVPRPAA
jgi:hypothetical protein